MTAGSAQEQWLRADLTANTKRCTVAHIHHPRFSSVGTGARKEVRPLWAALYDFRADIVISAHYREYERFAPQTPDEVADPEGLRQFTVGTGGQGVDKFGTGHRANSVVRADNVYGILKLTLGEGSYTWDFVPIPGVSFTDTGSGTCHTRVLVASVTVTPASASILAGATQQLTATPRDADGNPLTGRVVTWSSSNPAIATVDASGLVTAVTGGGPVTITATSEGKSGTSAITVTTIPAASVAVTPTAATIEAGGDTVRLTAVARDADGHVLAGHVPTWTSSNPAAATVAASGLVSGVAPDTTTITATIDGQSGTSDITVVPGAVASVDVSPATATIEAGAGMVFTATPRDARGNALTGREINWASSDETVVVADHDGMVSAVAPGTATLTATSEGKSGAAEITVVRAAVASVEVTPATASLVVGSTVQLTATPKSANGSSLSDRPVIWTSNNTAVATVDATGLVTGVGQGTATISATSEGKTGTASVGVGVVPVASVEVTPPTANIVVGSTVQLTATPKDANGNPLPGRTIAWTESDPAVASVDANGLVLGLTPGPVTITATVEGRSGTSAVTVAPAPPGSSVVLVGAGNIARCDRTGDEATAALLDAIPGTVFTDGDNAYPSGSVADYTSCYDPTWGRHRSRTRPSAGNHEYDDGVGQGYFAYFGAAAGDPAKGYYSYDLGAWHIIVLNSATASVSTDAGSPQEQWLRADLAAHAQRCTLAYWHHPRFYQGTFGKNSAVKPLWDDLYQAKADVVVNGHFHLYERYAPQTPAGDRDDAGGIRQFIAGTGGAGHDALVEPAPNVEVRDNTSWGVLKLTLRAGGYDWEFVPVAGATFTDAGSATCHSAAPTSNEAPTAQPGGPYYSEAAVAFDGSRSTDPDNNLPLSYSWNFGDGATGTGATPTHTYAADGSYTVALTVTDSKGLSGAAATTTATIGNLAPAVSAGPDVSVLAGVTFTLSATFSDPGAGDAPWAYTFDWGDGSTSSGSTNSQASAISAAHAYSAAGQYAARVTVTDKDGGAGWDEVLVTVSPSSTPQVFIGAGNIATCTNDRDEATAKLIDANPGTVFALGDNAFPDGTLTDYNTCYGPTWGRHKSRTHPTPGNHEYTSGTGTGYFDYWGAAAGVRNKGWYSYDLGDWHIIVLNDEVSFGTGSEQEAWLRADLAASTKQCTLAYWHVPRFFSSTSPGWTSSDSRKILWDDLYARGAEIVLNGQQHQYERMAPMRPDGTRDDVNGILEINAGTGGESAGLPTVIHPNSVTISAAFGVLKLILGPGNYSWQFLTIPGSTYTDSGSGTCH
jgi:uncharacterized protein YjdB/PKD repeat protein